MTRWWSTDRFHCIAQQPLSTAPRVQAKQSMHEAAEALRMLTLGNAMHRRHLDSLSAQRACSRAEREAAEAQARWLAFDRDMLTRATAQHEHGTAD